MTVRHLIKPTFAIALTVALACGTCHGAAVQTVAMDGSDSAVGDDWITHDYPADGLRLRLPMDWQAIPELAVREFADHASGQLQVSADNVLFKYGFQRGPIKRWFEAPYILVDVRPGRTPWRQLATMPAFERKISDNGAETPGRFESMPPDAIRIEKEKNIVWMKLTHRRPNGSTARCLSALFPTQKSVIQLNMYLPQTGDSGLANSFEQIALAVRLDPSLNYKPYPLEQLPLLGKLNWANPAMRYTEMMVVALVAGLFIVSIVLVKRNETEKMKRDSD